MTSLAEQDLKLISGLSWTARSARLLGVQFNPGENVERWEVNVEGRGEDPEVRSVQFPYPCELPAEVIAPLRIAVIRRQIGVDRA